VNKRDLPNANDSGRVEEAAAEKGEPIIEGMPSTATGVFETLKRTRQNGPRRTQKGRMIFRLLF